MEPTSSCADAAGEEALLLQSASAMAAAGTCSVSLALRSSTATPPAAAVTSTSVAYAVLVLKRRTCSLPAARVADCTHQLQHPQACTEHKDTEVCGVDRQLQPLAIGLLLSFTSHLRVQQGSLAWHPSMPG